MKTISYWALLNPKKTWVILTLIHLALGGLTTYLGILLFLKGIVVSDAVFMAGATLFMIACFLYPVRRSKYKIWKWSYARQKTYDFSLIISGLMMLLTITNQGAEIAMAKVDQNRGFAMQVAMHQQAPAARELTFWEKINISRIKKRLQEGFTNLIKEIQVTESDKPSNGWSIFGIIFLMSLLIIGGGYLSCQLYCSSGSGVWIIIYILFILFVLVIGITFIKKIKGSKRRLRWI